MNLLATQLVVFSACQTGVGDVQETLRQRPEYADPYFWGAFICQGDPGPLAS